MADNLFGIDTNIPLPRRVPATGDSQTDEKLSSFSAGWALAQESIAGGSQGLTGLLQEKIKQDLDEAQKIRDQLAKAEYEPVLRRDFSSNNPDARRRVNQYFQLQHLQKRQQELEARIERYSKLPLELESARNTLALIQSGGDFSPAQATRMWATRTPVLSPDERMAGSEAAARGETKGTLRGMAEMGVPPQEFKGNQRGLHVGPPFFMPPSGLILPQTANSTVEAGVCKLRLFPLLPPHY